MSNQTEPDIGSLQVHIKVALHAHWKFFLVQGILMIILGLVAVALPNLATLAVELFVGWLFVIGGVLRALSVWRARALPGYWWSLLTALLALVLGLLLILRPLEGVLTLTIVLVVLFIFEGIGAILIALEFRPHLRHWGWTLFSGLVDLLLAALIWGGWPSTAVWAIGLLVGINMVFFGVSLLMAAVAARSIGGA